MDIRNKNITVIGGQRSGLAVLRLIIEKKRKPRISEAQPSEKLSADIRDWIKNNQVDAEFGGHTEAFIKKSDLIVLSPGVRIDAQPVKWAKEAGILVLGEIEFAFQFCAKLVIAVTGSNGKTTTVNLIQQVINQSGKKACLCGNVGQPFSNFVVDGGKGYDYFVVEISSFQLESLVNSPTGFTVNDSSVKPFCPQVSVILNFSQNHLDRHKDLDEYFTAKKNIFLNQSAKEFAVLNFQDPYVKKFVEGIKSTVKYFNDPKDADYHANPNYAAVIKVAGILGISRQVCEKVFADFKGVEHRLEKILEINGVWFINDSKSTTVEATRWALSRFNEPIVLICGGRDKNLDYSVLKSLVKEKVKAIVAIGEAKQKIQNVYKEVVPVHLSGTIQEAVRDSYRLSKKGDVVVLSPMCASFDMFRDYEDRGRVFKESVKNFSADIAKDKIQV